ncbi:MAG: LysM peptidoglycan-binding domain-containing protein [Thiobacillus sp.]|jgi:membrane-bound lytic murein transglycosylase D|uniref:LysM peptidoglycan-binding domain-containing protein n=1 Tax=Thiobacillus sp. TaxID=924 RepID=UPI00289571AD|nr:LysM peptidoglycan-binding domain-containing protein [Thiobacillus sp.]MDT3706728.1 LysM peptidoglycan-binding domain-containing protein [Thiobacillus sp.]
MAHVKMNRLSLAVLALLFSYPAVAEESLTNYRPLEWQDGAFRDSTGDAAATLPQDEAQGETAEAARDAVEGETIAQTSQDDVWQRIRNGFGIAEDTSLNPLIGLHESWFAARPESVLRLVERSRPYLYHIVEELDRRAMPMEIALLPMIESAYNSAALSPAAASGIWQFMPATGRDYGLRQDNWYDGRGDFTAATRAALDYLAKLYLDFGDWQLALAAYNCGEGCVTRAIRRNAQEGLPTDYASLDLPNETRHYVPRLLAIKKLIDSPERYSLAIEALPNQPYFDQVTVRASMDVHSAARLANMSSNEFIALNAAFPRKLIHSDTPVNLLLPVDKVDTFQRNLETGTWDTWKPYAVKKGERPGTIAKRFGVSVARLAEHNQLHLKRGKFAGPQTILVPVKRRTVASTDTTSPSTGRHLVRRGDTLFGVARRYGLSVTQLAAANPKLGTELKIGQVVRLPSSESGARETEPIQPAQLKTASASPTQAARYTVKSGDNLNAIAQRFDISVADIKAWNPGFRKTSMVRAGQKVIVRKP